MIVAGAFADPAGCAVADLPPDAGRALAIGPEGGFSPQEIQIFDDHGWSRLCLGEHVLRAETAAIVGGALMVARDSGALGLRDC